MRDLDPLSTAKRSVEKWIHRSMCRSQPGHQLARSTGGWESAVNGSGECGARTVVSGGSKPQTFAPPRV